MSERDREEIETARHEQRLRELGTRHPICRECGEANPYALTGVYPDILCYECLALGDGRSPVEGHHDGGHHNDPHRVPILGNDHRILNVMQYDWPYETLRNPNGSPLLKAAAQLRGFLDILRLLIVRILGWIPSLLERLDQELTFVLGHRYWEQLNLNET